MIKVKEYNSEFEVLQKINMMNEEELVQYRIKNKEHNERIQKRTVRNFISGTIKRSIDIVTGLIGTITLIPITILVWIMKKINKEDGPIFYDQLRIGKDGKIFKLYKFRSMVVGADEILVEYLKTHHWTNGHNLFLY